jgi:hypothetical protein
MPDDPVKFELKAYLPDNVRGFKKAGKYIWIKKIIYLAFLIFFPKKAGKRFCFSQFT